jgi:hypothetical protein
MFIIYLMYQFFVKQIAFTKNEVRFELHVRWESYRYKPKLN